MRDFFQRLFSTSDAQATSALQPNLSRRSFMCACGCGMLALSSVGTALLAAASKVEAATGGPLLRVGHMPAGCVSHLLLAKLRGDFAAAGNDQTSQTTSPPHDQTPRAAGSPWSHNFHTACAARPWPHRAGEKRPSHECLRGKTNAGRFPANAPWHRSGVYFPSNQFRLNQVGAECSFEGARPQRVFAFQRAWCVRNLLCLCSGFTSKIPPPNITTKPLAQRASRVQRSINKLKPIFTQR